jgi:XTP/dITP diphosphohydrolase
MPKIVLASGNTGKLKELKDILDTKDVELVSQSEFNVSEADETGLSFIENALIKARHACKITGMPAIADDSGIEVDALNGRPGIYSARYAGMSGDRADAQNNLKLLSELDQVPESQRTARFQCVIVLMHHALDPMPLFAKAPGKAESYLRNLAITALAMIHYFMSPLMIARLQIWIQKPRIP